MKLYLVQHGEACGKDVDPDRPLTDQGQADIERLAAFLGQAGIEIERVLHSGKLRAAQTAQRLASAVAPELELETSAILNPNDDPEVLDAQLGNENKDTLVVGHLPFMGRLVSHLVIADKSRPITAWQPGSMVCLERNNGSDWQINWMLRPKLFR